MAFVEKKDQARRDRQREIARLENELRRIQAQPGSELLVEHYASRIERLYSRNNVGTTHANLTSTPEGHNPRVWPVIGGW